MWPFKKRSAAVVSIALDELSFSQTDATERSGDNLSLGPNDWIETVALNAVVASPESMGALRYPVLTSHGTRLARCLNTP